MQSHGEGKVILPTPAAFPSFLLHPVLMPPWANHSLCSRDSFIPVHSTTGEWGKKGTANNKSGSNKCRTAEITERCLQNTNATTGCKMCGVKSRPCFIKLFS